jgi:hypothetical protein
MYSFDVCRVKRKEAPKKPRKSGTSSKTKTHDVEYVCASARLAEVIEILGK